MKISRFINSHSAILIIGIFSATSFLGYLLFSNQFYKTGFPLDDAWIHQAFARNFAEHGEWALIHGYPATGSTAPLWSLMLAPASWISTSPLCWTFFLGYLILFCSGVIIEKIFRELYHEALFTWPVMGIFLVGEWHIVWASASGMETGFFCLLELVVVYLLLVKNEYHFAAGLLIGVSVWVRPEGITLLGPAIFLIVMEKNPGKNKLRNIGSLLVSFFSCVLPYIILNHSISRNWLPNTFSAKQAEYAILTQASLLNRFAKIALQPFVGPSILLIPGLVFLLWSDLRKNEWRTFALCLWIGGFLLLYAIFLPVTYQHGRYMIPVMPIIFLLGGTGTVGLVLRYSGKIRKYLQLAIGVSVTVVWLMFYFIGGKAYAEDVAIIESEMVMTGKWIAGNLPEDSVLAVHDIGAVGYFGQRKIVDLAGLVTPEIIPIIQDERMIKQYLIQQQVDFLVTFPGWYSLLPSDLVIVYTTGGSFSPAAGGENMTIFKME